MSTLEWQGDPTRPWHTLLAAAVTLALRDFTDTGVILAVLLLNAVIGFVQEARAQQEMLALATLAAPRAEVVRQGLARTLPSRELVPGDRVLLTSGARVPADLRLVARPWRRSRPPAGPASGC